MVGIFESNLVTRDLMLKMSNILSSLKRGLVCAKKIRGMIVLPDHRNSSCVKLDSHREITCKFSIAEQNVYTLSHFELLQVLQPYLHFNSYATSGKKTHCDIKKALLSS